MRLAALIEQGRRSFQGPSEPPTAVAHLLQLQETASVYDSVHSRMLECVDQADRGRCALTLLLQSTECCVGSLFGVVDETHVQLLAALPEHGVEPGLRSWLESFLAAEQSPDETQTASIAAEEDTDQLDDQNAYTDGEGRRFEVTVLLADRSGENRIVGLLALQVGAGLHMRPPMQLCHEIAHSLIEQGDLG